MPPRNISSTPSLVPHSTKSGVTLRASARGHTATIESPRMATAPSSITRRCASMVTTVPPVTSKSTLSLADAVEERTKAATQHISAENARFGQLLQEQNLFLFCIFPLRAENPTEMRNQRAAATVSQRSRARPCLSGLQESPAHLHRIPKRFGGRPRTEASAHLYRLQPRSLQIRARLLTRP